MVFTSHLRTLIFLSKFRQSSYKLIVSIISLSGGAVHGYLETSFVFVSAAGEAGAFHGNRLFLI